MYMISTLYLDRIYVVILCRGLPIVSTCACIHFTVVVIARYYNYTIIANTPRYSVQAILLIDFIVYFDIYVNIMCNVIS